MKLIQNGIAGFICLMLLAGCNNRNNQRTEVVRKVKLAQVCQSDSLEKRSYTGIINEKQSISLAFRVAGALARINIEAGDFVRKGDLIAQIDSRDYEVQLLAAQGQYDQVKAEADRVIELHARKSVAGNDYDKAIAGVKMTEANLAHARNQLNDTRLLAPVSGYIHEVNYSAGEMVSAGMPVASLIDISGYHIEIDIPAELYHRRKDFVSFTGSLPSANSKEFSLEVSAIAQKAGNNQLYTIRLKPEDDSRPSLSPGMSAQVDIILNTGMHNMMCIPLNAVFEREGSSYVWVYHPDEGVVKSRRVEINGLAGENLLNVTEGLNIGEQVVAAGVHYLRENSKVEVLQPIPETNVGGLL